MSYLAELATELGISTWILIVIAVWSLTWKLIGMWKSARNKHLVWFMVIALFNSIGIIPILYVYVFSDLSNFKENNMKKPKSKKKPVKKKTKK